MKKLYRIIFILISLNLCTSQASAQNYSENELQAVYYYKISKFIRWKENEKKTINLCTIGDIKDEKNVSIADVLKKLIQDKKTPYVIHENIKIKDLENCNMIYIGQDAEHNLQDVLFLSKKHSIVTISNISSFARRGGMFTLVRNAQGQFSVELNYDNAQKSNININASLLEIIRVTK